VNWRWRLAHWQAHHVALMRMRSAIPPLYLRTMHFGTIVPDLSFQLGWPRWITPSLVYPEPPAETTASVFQTGAVTFLTSLPQSIGAAMHGARFTPDKSVRWHSQQVAYQSSGNGIKGQPHPLSFAALGIGASRDAEWAMKTFRSAGSSVAISGNRWNSARMARHLCYSRSTPQIPVFQTKRC
jgi:hypothetical protein